MGAGAGVLLVLSLGAGPGLRANPPASPTGDVRPAEATSDARSVESTSSGSPAVRTPGIPAAATGAGAREGVGLGAGAAGGPGTVDQLTRGWLEPAVERSASTQAEIHQEMLETARRHRQEGLLDQAAKDLVALLRSSAGEEVKRPALMELALVAQEQGLLGRAQQIFSQYAQLYAQHPSVIEAHLRQGILYRQMGVTALALTKLYAVMTTALSLRLDQLEYYQRLVLLAQVEIADTHYLAGRWEEAGEFLKRLLKLDSPHLDRAQVHYKLVRALAMQNRHEETVAQSQTFIEAYPEHPETAEVRFLLASALKQQGRNEDASRQVLALIEAQRALAGGQPQAWIYWQKRAGNEIGNQLYREGDYVGALVIFQRLADLDASGEWQLPVWYQMGLLCERLNQPARAAELYGAVIGREKEYTAPDSPPSLRAVIEMARWRRDNLSWFSGAVASATALRPPAAITNRVEAP